MKEALSPDQPVIANWLRDRRALLRLFLLPLWRRNGLRLAWLSVKEWLRWPVLAGSAFAAALTFLGAGLILQQPATAFLWLQGIALVSAILLGSAVLVPERQAGTFDLIWLATGSESRVLRWKLTGVLAAGLLTLLPSIALAAWYQGDPVLGALLLVQLVPPFLMALMLTLRAGVLVPHAWAAGILSGAALGVVYAAVGTSATILNPFLNPWGDSVKVGGMVTNRLLLLGVAVYLFRASCRNLRERS